MIINKLLKVLPLTTVGVAGLIGGIVYEKYKPFDFTTAVKAAAPVIPTSFPIPPHPGVGRSTQIMKFGFPGSDNIRLLDNYVISYDQRNRVAHWVYEHFTHEDLKKDPAVNRSLCEFHEDETIHPFFRSTNDDYKGSGFDRGHLAAAGNQRRSLEHCKQTFLMSNMAPQVGKGFNRGMWNKLEKYCRALTKYYANVYVCSGPLYLPRKGTDGNLYVKYRVIGPNNVAVPTHFFKVIVLESANKELELETFVLPNKAIDDKILLHSFQVPLDSIERAAGLRFFDKIPKESFKRINGKNISFI